MRSRAARAAFAGLSAALMACAATPSEARPEGAPAAALHAEPAGRDGRPEARPRGGDGLAAARPHGGDGLAAVRPHGGDGLAAVRPLACSDGLTPVARPLRWPVVLDPRRPALHCEGPDRWALRLGERWWNVPLKGRRRPGELALAGDAFVFDLAPSPPAATGMDKLMVELFGRLGRQGLLPPDAEVVVAFELRLAPGFEAPEAGARFLVWQLFQGAPYAPPLRLEISPDRELVLYLMNDATGSQPCAAEASCRSRLAPPLTGVRELHRSAPLTPGTWLAVRVALRPSWMSGAVALWLGAAGAPVARYEGPVGYDPAGWAGYPGLPRPGARHPSAVMDLSFGVYRTAQDRRQGVAFRRIEVRRQGASQPSTAAKWSSQEGRVRARAAATFAP